MQWFMRILQTNPESNPVALCSLLGPAAIWTCIQGDHKAKEIHVFSRSVWESKVLINSEYGTSYYLPFTMGKGRKES